MLALETNSGLADAVMEDLKLRISLDAYFREVSAVIVDKQNPITGLLPASTAVNTHGDYRDAWVRDNVYSILAVWGLALAYRSLDDDEGRGRELEQRTVFLMRGLLRSMMSQSAKVEAFKKTRDRGDSLHAKYDTETGSTVVGDDAWGHLQIDATSVFLLQLAQMIASGLDIIWTMDEVAFVQNLVYYIERAYRTPDYGIWERGAKTNLGRVELNASSLGMAKAALEALDGFNLFGARGSHASVVHVSPDNIAQADITLREMLPRESHTKEVDAAVLSVIGYPAFAVHDEALVRKTRDEIVGKLEGKYGCKRFLLDGHQTVVEDEGRLHYEAEELKLFENIESEWPLFFTYLYLDALLRHDKEKVEHYGKLLAGLVVERDGQKLLPELYIVPRECIAAEKAQPGSQQRVANENVPLVWAQSLYLLGRMLEDGLLNARDLDPLGRRQHKGASAPVVQILLLAEDESLQTELAAHGVRSETLEDISPVEVFVAEDIARAHGEVGRSQKLGLTGRAARALKSLTTSRLYQIDKRTVVCLAPFFVQRDFYLSYDLHFVLRRFERELAYLRRHWSQPGRPTVAVMVTRALLDAEATPFYEMMRKVAAGEVAGIPVRQGTLVELLPTASFERLDGLSDIQLPAAPLSTLLHPPHALRLSHDSVPLDPATEREIETTTDNALLIARLAETENLFEQMEILGVLTARLGLGASIAVGESEALLSEMLDEIYEAAGAARKWAVVRRAAGLLGKVDVDLSLACSALLVAHKHIQVGRAYSSESLITDPVPDQELAAIIERFCREDVRDRVLTQEVLLYLGLLVRARPELFHSLLTIRVGHLIGLLTGQIAREQELPIEDAYEALLAKAPSEIEARLERVLAQYVEIETLPQQLEHMAIKAAPGQLSWSEDAGLASLKEPKEGWHGWRQLRGVIDRRPDNFYARTFNAFRHVPCIVIGDKLDRKNRVESRLVLSDMTAGEKSFALLLEHLLNKVAAPEYRHLNIEALSVIGSFFEQNAELQIADALYVDAVIGHAVRLFYLARQPERETNYDSEKVTAWSQFYAAPPAETASALVAAIRFLLGNEEEARKVVA